MTQFIKTLSAGIAAFALLSFSTLSMAGNTVEIEVDGLVCAFCAQGITKNLKKLPATEGVFVSLENKLVAMSVKDGQDITDGQLTEVLTGAGYTVRSISRSQRSLSEIESSVKAK